MPGPLNGLKILDFTTLLPGPYATMVLADMGADVLRVVSRSRPDVVAYIPPLVPGIDLSAAFVYLGRNKRCMTLNLKDSRAIRIIHQLISHYDILIEQFRPGVMAKFDLDYGSLSKINPSLIYCSLTGYGQTGTLRDRAGHDINYLARSGIMSYSGKKDGGPSLSSMQIADVASGSDNAIIGILAAVIDRGRTGRGQHIDISMTDGVIAFNAMYGAGFLVDGKEPLREQILLNGGSLYDFYETKDGGYLSVGSIEPQFFAAFCKVINCPDLIPGGIEPMDIENVKKRVKEIIKTRTRDEWVEEFSKVDACVEPVLSLSEALNNTYTKERELVVEVELPDGGKVRQLACPIKFSRTPSEYKQAGVSPGLHTKEVLLELGYSEEEIEKWEKTGLFN
ncbi:MAG TPA: CaiB/BaiF CoA-transferase family protein [Syntrophales bacterium]|nr:CaiB/BaiF CoA-transferase family protein [Syntrophales bacterium]